MPAEYDAAMLRHSAAVGNWAPEATCLLASSSSMATMRPSASKSSTTPAAAPHSQQPACPQSGHTERRRRGRTRSHRAILPSKRYHALLRASVSRLPDPPEHFRRMLPSTGGARSAAARRPLIVMGERTLGIVPPLASGCGRSSRMARAITCGSANASAMVLIGPAGTLAFSNCAVRSARVLLGQISQGAGSACRD